MLLSEIESVESNWFGHKNYDFDLGPLSFIQTKVQNWPFFLCGALVCQKVPSTHLAPVG